MMRIERRFIKGNPTMAARATLRAETDDEARFISALCEAILAGEPVELPVGGKVFFVEGNYLISKQPPAGKDAEDTVS